MKARGTKSVTWGVTLRRVEGGVPATVAATGTVVAVCLAGPTIARDGKPAAVPIPESVARWLVPTSD